jgi:SRSO17 transposase
VRVRHAGGNIGKARLHPEQWLLIDGLRRRGRSNIIFRIFRRHALNDLVSQAHMRWRIERDYQDLKQELGLGHYEGRGWRGFHHHASLSIAAYGFLVAERMAADKPVGAKKNFVIRQMPALPPDYVPRGSPARATPRGRLDRHHTLRAELSADRPTRTTSTPRPKKRSKILVTQ